MTIGFRENLVALGVLQMCSAAICNAEAVTGEAPQSPESGGLEEIVVTAQKRSESINKVGMSIVAASQDTLVERGITTVADLQKIVPGLTFTPSQQQQPVYVLRGVGLYESGLASSPAVTVYVDQIPLATPVISEVAPLDLQRVEVLKGPQGTLFGANSTGGVINYIAAKPTSLFAAGADLSYDRFGRADAMEFVSGPLGDTVTARLAVQSITGGSYQYSLSRPDDHLGDARTYQGRLLLDWHSGDNLAVELNVTGFKDSDDTTAQQFVLAKPPNPALANANLLDAVPAPNDPRAADWSAGYPLRSNDRFEQGSLRVDYTLSGGTILTSLTSYQHFDEDKLVDSAGLNGATSILTQGPSNLQHSLGNISAASEELRLAGTAGALRWTAGTNYQHQTVDERQLLTINATISQPLPFLPPYSFAGGSTEQTINEGALFASGDYELTDHLIAHAGTRYTISDRAGESCSYDWNPAGDQNALANQFLGLQSVFQALGLKTAPVVPIAPGGCLALTPPPTVNPGAVNSRLDNQNVSWRFGLDYLTDDGSLLYANASRGFKSGVIGVFVAAAQSEYAPAREERLDAYELGFKTPFAGGKLHLDGAAFYYDYRNKQVRSHILDPAFGLLELLQNVPKSRVIGSELSLQAEPIRGLQLTLAGTYLYSQVLGSFDSYNAASNYGDFSGAALPYTARVQGTADSQYSWLLRGNLEAFVGASLTYHSRANATFDSPSAPAPGFELNSYAIVDLRTGVASADGKWRVSLFGHNITNRFYPVSFFYAGDEVTRTVGRPATFGISVSVRLH